MTPFLKQALFVFFHLFYICNGMIHKNDNYLAYYFNTETEKQFFQYK